MAAAELRLSKTKVGALPAEVGVANKSTQLKEAQPNCL